MSRFRPKSLLKKVAARLVPPEVVYRRKMGFGVPVGDWFRGEIKDFVREVLLSESLTARGLFEPKVVHRLYHEHVDLNVDHTFKLWALLMLELWFRRFIDKN